MRTDETKVDLTTTEGPRCYDAARLVFETDRRLLQKLVIFLPFCLIKGQNKYGTSKVFGEFYRTNDKLSTSNYLT